ncbi:hypothetical protein [uncultured Lamprocystis sp.]|uniref:hypothetical protein n=1 Tax=uncultured Lamprocystis sp. TaxID=543132 RepID=UPI0025FF2B7F|nr:hypothetical protein [uncultured Lamprocystis sp.]
MGDYNFVAVSELTEARLDSSYYATRFLRNEKRLASFGIDRKSVSDLAGLCNCGATPKQVVYGHTGVGLIRTTDVRPNEFLDDDILRTTDLTSVSLRESIQVRSGDIVYTMSGTIGYCCVIPQTPEVFSFSNTIVRLRLPKTTVDDPHYVSTFFNCKYGYEQSLRLVSGGIQGHVMPNPFKTLLISLPDRHLQRYIGDKVRQAERLRARAKGCLSTLVKFVETPESEQALATRSKMTGRIPPGLLTARLDAKYYGNHSVEVLRVAQTATESIGSLLLSISNGFEERSFCSEGVPYVTVSEVSSGRLILSSAPRISPDVEIPRKAYINERCVLVVRTGSIGTAVKVDRRDTAAVISSHLIRLEFDSEATACAVAAFLSSPSGKVLQHKISYGAVQPQIGQDELICLPVPDHVLEEAEHILQLTKSREDGIRLSQSLVSAAKLLVESLIEGQITEVQLIAAQQALEAGDDSLDRVILARLKTDGLDGAGEPLFPDLDQLYDLLERAQPESGA